MRLLTTGAAAGVMLAVACAGPANAQTDDVRDYEVTMFNLTRGQPLSPPVIATHRGDAKVWHLTQAASLEVKEIAENGNNAPLLNKLRLQRNSGSVFDYQQAASAAMAPGPLVPGGRAGSATFPDKVTARIRGSRRNNRISWVSMLVCSNDGFTGVDGAKLPAKRGKRVVYQTSAYETQTERNTEDFADIMPPCQALIGVRPADGAPGVAQSNPALAESGNIIPSSGIVGNNELDPATFGWSNPVGKIMIKRVR